MVGDTPAPAEDLLDFWFGTLGPDGVPPKERSARWFRRDAAFDAELVRRFGQHIERALAGAHDGWAESPRGRLALVLLLDQLTRNVYRGTAQAFAGDAQARALSLAAAGSDAERALALIERSFLYMPLMHAEDATVQDRSVALFSALAEEGVGAITEKLAANRGYAISHREVIVGFGRFPGRNQALGRESTPEELVYLEEDGGF